MQRLPTDQSGWFAAVNVPSSVPPVRRAAWRKGVTLVS